MMRPWERLLRVVFRALFRHTVQRGLRGVWVQGDLPGQVCVLAGNHHSWWDGYLLPVLFWEARKPFKIVVGERRLQEFSFFQYLDTISASKPREALHKLKHGEVLIVFPEGELRAPGSMGVLSKGTVWFAEKAGVPIVPVASRVVLRGHESAEAYLVFAEPIEPDLDLLYQRLDRMLADLDNQIRTVPAETALPGFKLMIAGRKSTHEPMAWWGQRWVN